ncbi:MAG: hypothetical protein IJY89_02610, partial [Clostridia bacterium]|nr:hypothetical protein [Clostridia bacterium]
MRPFERAFLFGSFSLCLWPPKKKNRRTVIANSTGVFRRKLFRESPPQTPIMGLCPIPYQRNFLKKVSLESSKTFDGGKNTIAAKMEQNA